MSAGATSARPKRMSTLLERSRNTRSLSYELVDRIQTIRDSLLGASLKSAPDSPVDKEAPAGVVGILQTELDTINENLVKVELTLNEIQSEVPESGEEVS